MPALSRPLAGSSGVAAISRRCHCKNAHLSCDVLDTLFAEVVEFDGKPVTHLVAHATGHAKASRLAERF